MALLNILKSNTYSRIDYSTIDKINKHVSFSLTVYDKNEDALTKITSMNFFFPVQFVPIDFQLAGKIPMETLKHAPTTEEEYTAMSGLIPPHWHWYLIPGGAEGDWEAFIGKIIRYELSEYKWVEVPTSEIVRRFNQEYYLYRDGVWIRNPTVFTEDDWNEYFSPSAMENSNLIKQLYMYLKEFLNLDNIIDA